MNEARKQNLTWALVALVVVGLAWSLRTMLGPFVAAVLAGYVLEQPVRWLSRRLPRVIAVLLTLVVSVLVVLSLLLIVVPIVQQQVGLIRQQAPQALAAITDTVLPRIQQVLGNRYHIQIDQKAVVDWITQNLAASGEQIASNVWNYLRIGGSAAMTVIGFLFLLPVLVFYLLMDWTDIWRRARTLIPQRWRTGVYRFAGDVDHVLGQFFRGQLLVMLSLAVFYSAGLLVGGVELWLPIGLLTGLLVFVPYVGFGLGLVFALIAGTLQLGFLHGLVVVGIVYGLGQALESFWLTPRLVGGSVGLHPIVVIFALVAFGSLFGFVGVLLAVPATAVLAVAWRYLRESFVTSEFYNRDA